MFLGSGSPVPPGLAGRTFIPAYPQGEVNRIVAVIGRIGPVMTCHGRRLLGGSRACSLSGRLTGR